MPSIFSKIVAGEIPCYKIYEDDTVLAFLDIHPESKGHTLVIYSHLFAVVKKLSKHFAQKLCARTRIKIVGTDVPHAHIHLTPLDPNWQQGRTLELSEADFKSIQEKLKLI